MHIILDGTVRTGEVSSSTEVGRWLTIGLQKNTEDHENWAVEYRYETPVWC